MRKAVPLWLLIVGKWGSNVPLRMGVFVVIINEYAPVWQIG
jgi:hypothetical protein